MSEINDDDFVWFYDDGTYEVIKIAKEVSFHYDDGKLYFWSDGVVT